MNKLKLYLIISFTGFVLFLISFAISWNSATQMSTVYTLTVPFLLVTIAPLIAFAFSGVDSECDCSAQKIKLDVLSVFNKSSNISSSINTKYCLSRIS